MWTVVIIPLRNIDVRDAERNLNFLGKATFPVCPAEIAAIL